MIPALLLGFYKSICELNILEDFARVLFILTILINDWIDLINKI